MTCFSRTTNLWRYVYPNSRSTAARQKRNTFHWSHRQITGEYLPTTCTRPWVPEILLTRQCLHSQKESIVKTPCHSHVTYQSSMVSHQSILIFHLLLPESMRYWILYLQNFSNVDLYLDLLSNTSLWHQTPACFQSHAYSKMQTQKKGFMDLMVSQMEIGKRGNMYASKSIRYWLRLARERW